MAKLWVSFLSSIRDHLVLCVNFHVTSVFATKNPVSWGNQGPFWPLPPAPNSFLSPLLIPTFHISHGFRGAIPVMPGRQELPIFGIVHQFHKFRSHATIYYLSSKKNSVSLIIPAFHRRRAPAPCSRAICQVTHTTRSFTAPLRATGFELHRQQATYTKPSSAESRPPCLGVTSGSHPVPPHAPSGTNCQRCIRPAMALAEF